MRGGWCGKSGGFLEGQPRSESVSGSSSRNPSTSQHGIPVAQGSEHSPLVSLPLCLCGSDGPSSPVQQFQVLIQRFPQTTVHPVPCYHLGVDSVASCDCYNLGGGAAMT